MAPRCVWFRSLKCRLNYGGLTFMTDFWQLMFALTFFVARIIVGLTSSFLWWGTMLSNLNEGRAHSPIIYIVYLTSNAILSGLNIFWFVQIIMTLRKAAGAKDASKVASEADDKTA